MPTAAQIQDMKYSVDKAIRSEGFRLEALAAAKEYVSLAVSALATLRERTPKEDHSITDEVSIRNRTNHNKIAMILTEIGTVQWRLEELK